MQFVPQSAETITIKVLPRVAKGVWIATAGILNFKDAAGVAQSLAAGYFLAGNQYSMGITEITSGTTAVGIILY